MRRQGPSGDPPHWDPSFIDIVGEVEPRPLEDYDALLEEVMR